MQSESRYIYYKGLDSFRGIGILWIICCHYFPGYGFFKFGWVSLEVFFVLSGFLITKVLLNSINENHYFKNFYARRALRIFPIYYLFIGVFFLALFIFSKANSFQFLKNNYPYYFIYLQNFLFVFNGLEPLSYLNHLWSLAMEEQFYFIWPITIYYIRNITTLRKLLIITIIIVFIIRLVIWWKWGYRYETYHCNTFARIDTIAFGCFLGCGFSYTELTKKVRSLIIILSVSVFPIGIILFKNPYVTNPLFSTIGYTSISILTIFFIEYFIKEKTKFKFLKNNWLINYLGQISYGVYLFHIPVFYIINFKSNLPNPVNGIVSMILSFSIAAISYKFYEQRFLNLKKKFIH